MWARVYTCIGVTDVYVTICTFSDGMQEFEESYSAALEKYGQQVTQQKDPANPRSFREAGRQDTSEAKDGRREKEVETKVVAHLTVSEEYQLAEALDYEVVDTSFDPLETIAVSCPVSSIGHVPKSSVIPTIMPPSFIQCSLYCMKLICSLYCDVGWSHLDGDVEGSYERERVRCTGLQVCSMQETHWNE